LPARFAPVGPIRVFPVFSMLLLLVVFRIA
jgi:hypothetical protein